ncbi:zinc finger protein Pegasus [Callorhinchus milii]|uniref:Zinc finger protein Pegasus-like n=1 Tax=Callorhinchus milii TaxID=7868 RepID=V9KZ70_CALMI|nr:zinc finger protein Pegasus [Callorhinchus milii]|eukprot:gi/632987123/ref/XP_007910617.1/ PREDICTED: zinc finger protein Pegasus-like [Callorhinchus milii]
MNNFGIPNTFVIVTDGKLKCTLCPHLTEDLKAMREHLSTHPVYRCQHCTFATYEKYNFEHHLTAHDKTNVHQLKNQFCSSGENNSPCKETPITTTSKIFIIKSPKKHYSSLSDLKSFKSFTRHRYSRQNRHHDQLSSKTKPAEKQSFRDHACLNNCAQKDTQNVWRHKDEYLHTQVDSLHGKECSETDPDADSQRPFAPVMQGAGNQASTFSVDSKGTSVPSMIEPKSVEQGNKNETVEGNGRLGSSSSWNVLGTSPGNTFSVPASPLQSLHHCRYCDSYYADATMYTIHMGCHSLEHPFKCNICGHQCADKYDFTCHFIQGPHRKTDPN